MTNDLSLQRRLSACGWFFVCVTLLLIRLWGMWELPLLDTFLFRVGKLFDATSLLSFFVPLGLGLLIILCGIIAIVIGARKLFYRLRTMWPLMAHSRRNSMLVSFAFLATTLLVMSLFDAKDSIIYTLWPLSPQGMVLMGSDQMGIGSMRHAETIGLLIAVATWIAAWLSLLRAALMRN